MSEIDGLTSFELMFREELREALNDRYQHRHTPQEVLTFEKRLDGVDQYFAIVARGRQEYMRLSKIATQAKHAGAEDALCTTLTAMNTLTKVLGFTPEGDEL